MAELPPGEADTPRGTTASLEGVLDELIEEMVSHDPEFLAVAGDLVGGHWSNPSAEAKNLLGVADSSDERFLEVAADTYYGAWKRRFAMVGPVPIYAAVGDHDIGDNPWPAGSTKARQVPRYRELFARHFTRDPNGGSRFEEPLYPGVSARPLGTPQEDTAYAVKVRNLLFVTLDVFHQPKPNAGGLDQGSVEATVAMGQLAWLQAVLEAAECDADLDHVVVQGHVPVLTPVRLQSSSGITLREGEQSALWRLLSTHGVSAYLAGEVHAVSANVGGQDGGPVQIAHGRPPTYGGSNFLVVTVAGERLIMDLYSASIRRDNTDVFWSIDGDRHAGHASLAESPVRVGELVLRREGADIEIEEASGWLEVVEPDLPLLHYPFDEDAGAARNVGSFRNEFYELSLPDSVARSTGVIGRALQLSGTQRSEPAQAGGPLIRGEARTLALWLRTTATRPQDVAGWGSGNGLFWLETREGHVRLRTGTSTWSTAMAPTVTDGAWHHIAVVLPSTGRPALDDVQLYVDGSKAPSDSSSPDSSVKTSASPGFAVGAHAGSDVHPFEGDLDEVMVFAKALSGPQVRRLFEQRRD